MGETSAALRVACSAAAARVAAALATALWCAPAPARNLYLSALRAFGYDDARFGDCTGEIDGLARA